MSVHRIFTDLYDALNIGIADVSDPGDGETIVVGTKGKAICNVTTAGAESRTLEDATTLPIGTQLLVVFKEDGGDLTLSSDDADVVLTDEGDLALFTVSQTSSANEWRHDGGTDSAESYLEREQTHKISALDWRVHDAPGTFLSAGAGSNDDLGLTEGTYASSQTTLNATIDDVSSTQYARTQFRVPDNYTAGEDLTITANVTENAAADTAASVNFVVRESDNQGTDICATGSQSVLGASADDFDFTITGTNVSPGDILDIRVNITIDDSAGTTAAADYEINSVRVGYTPVVA